MSSLDTWVDRLAPRVRIKSSIARQALAEFLATFVFMSFGIGANAQSVLSDGENGNTLTVHWAWGIALTMAIHIGFGVSGAGHVNPAVTMALAVAGKFPWNCMPIYVLVQFLGSFLAVMVIYGVYFNALNEFDGGERAVFGANATAGIWATYPQDYLSIGNAIWDQIFATYMVIVCILAVLDSRNTRPPSGMEPFVVGLIIFNLGNCFSFNAGSAINPTRDLAPRLFTYLVGYGPEVWTPYGWHWWWIPIVMPMVGSTLGAFTYVFLVEIHHPPQEGVDQGQDISLTDLTKENATKSVEAEKDKVGIDHNWNGINASTQVEDTGQCATNEAFEDDHL